MTSSSTSVDELDSDAILGISFDVLGSDVVSGFSLYVLGPATDIASFKICINVHITVILY